MPWPQIPRKKTLKRRAPHTRIDNRIFDFMDIIGTNGFAVYAVLKKHENRHTGRCYPSYATVAEIKGLDRTTVIKYTTLLVTLGLINKQAQPRPITSGDKEFSCLVEYFDEVNKSAGLTTKLTVEGDEIVVALQ